LRSKSGDLTTEFPRAKSDEKKLEISGRVGRKMSQNVTPENKNTSLDSPR
jgi:hypothetical protein